VACLKDRLALYESTKNTEYLMDVANFAMAEFMLPPEDAFFESTGKSPGVIDLNGDRIFMKGE
jgi:hypothetical protein